MAPRDGRGHGADRPSEFPKAGWLDIARRSKDRFGEENLDIVAAGIAFNEFFALFPALAAAISIYGLVADPETVRQHVAAIPDMMPAGAGSVVEEQLGKLASAPRSGLGWSLALSLLVALWGATRGVKAMISGLNVVYEEDEKRGFFHLALIALGLTLAAIVFGIVSLALIAALPAVIDFLPLGDLGRLLAKVLRWPLLGVLAAVALAALYRYGPSRERPRWRWVSWGAAVAVALWLAGSALLSLYVSNMGSFPETYGSLAAVAVTLLWFQLTGLAVLLGGLIDAEMERQSGRAT